MYKQNTDNATVQNFSDIQLLPGSSLTPKRCRHLNTVWLFMLMITVSLAAHSKVPDKASYSNPREMSINDLTIMNSDESIIEGPIGLDEMIPFVQPKRLSEEINVLLQDADNGDSDSQYALYWLYLDGSYIARDEIQALVWLQKAVEQNHPFAMYVLALQYSSGHLIEQNHEKAQLLFEQAAAAGIDIANTNLGIIHEKGLGTEPNKNLAKKHYQLAAENDEPYAANELGRLLLAEHEYPLAKKWFQKAADQDLAPAKFNLGLMNLLGLGMPKDKKAAYLLIDEAAAAQVPKAMAAKGRMYLLGLNGPIDQPQAKKLLIQAYTAGEKNAALSLVSFEPDNEQTWVDSDEIGKTLSAGIALDEPFAKTAMGIRHLLFARNDVDRQTGLQLVKAAATDGNSVAQYFMGVIYNFDGVVPTDYNMAARWYRAAADNGMYEAKFRLAYLYYQGKGVQKDLEKFFTLISEVAKIGHQIARYDIAVAYRNGEGVKKNQTLALRKFKELAEEGMPLARYELARIYAHKNSGVTDEKKARYWLKQLLKLDTPAFQVRAAEIYSESLGDHKAALPLYQEAADRSDPIAINALGVMYKLGQGVKPDWDRAIRLYKQAADMGNAMAMNNYGYAFLTGEGVEENHSEALKWIKPSAEKGFSMAQNNLGHIFFEGLVGNVDYQKARKWFEKAAAQQDTNALHNLGLIYFYGKGVKKDLDKAETLFRKSAATGNKDAIKRVHQYDEEDRVLGLANSGKFTPREMWLQANDYLNGTNDTSLNLRLGLKLALKSMEAGYEQAYLLVATLYEKGLAVEADSEKVIATLKDAAAKIHSYDAMQRLATYYHKGSYVTKDECTALDWYWKMSLIGGDKGPSVINLMLETPLCNDKSRQETMPWLLKLVNQQEPDAVCLLGLLHSIGVGVEKSESKSLQFQLKAADLGSHHCQMRAGVFYATGNGVKKDRAKARLWLKSAAQAGSADAIQNFAYFLLTGPALERDLVEVYKWYWLSIEKGKTENKDTLLKLEKYMKSEEIIEAKKRGRSWGAL
ncbi:MAG: SEL1-like repeat protein [Chromatiales bacterium]|jgi:TPR repeat protein